MKKIKWIIGYFDSYGACHHHVVYEGDSQDSHNQIWPGRAAAHGKWRWAPTRPNHISAYDEQLTDDELYKIYEIVEKKTNDY